MGRKVENSHTENRQIQYLEILETQEQFKLNFSVCELPVCEIHMTSATDSNIFMFNYLALLGK